MEQLPTTRVQVPPGWPTIPDAPLTGAVQLHGEQAGPVVYVPGPEGRMVAVLREHLPTAPVVYQPRDLTPQPLIDPRAQRLAAGGLLAGGIGYGGGQLLLGAGQVLSAATGLGTVAMCAAVAVAASRIAPALGAGRTATVHHHTTNITTTTRWWGRTTTHVR
ncbi:hypothetical protein OOK39_46045 [Streptomyces sp. NBC_00264]|uniref:hypothetical protein n=1 Tax=unclassified Streptomyces TaxID=2593676 RepID=UPI0022536C26|nr:MULTISPECIES: hypothetical protein [unclassified Streptomyces]MCX5166380.1 hypothetical protein [Streptomyces sp. NBC_00305]MCX5166401.1 hypothetical protein [Streptomyces sp. NBC_00305]MCX5224898.1 hypothetical protein [Streptomyces sp. NBC_00264]